MERVLSAELHKHVGQEVRIAGWLHRQRELKAVTFLIVRDRKGLSQVVVPSNAEFLVGLTEETVIEVTGTVVANPQAPDGVEITEASVTRLSGTAEVPPFELFRPQLTASMPAQLDHASVALRHLKSRAAFEINAASVSGFRSTLDTLDFTEIQTPKIVGTATESGANVFKLDYFGQPGYLAQSPQFYKQTMVGVFERVYEVGPVFRAEPHDTTRHLAEYVSLDAEFGFIEDHTTVMETLQAVLAGMLASINDRASQAVERLGISLPSLDNRIPVLHFADAQQMIETATGVPTIGEPDLSPADERWLGEWALREHNSDFVFVTGYPMAKRPFYTHPDPARPKYTNSFDLLFKGVELVTGGQRLHNYADYLNALAQRGESADAYSSYLEPFKHGMPPHGGFAIGLERWTARIVGAANIRETTLFPRDRTRLFP